MNVSSVKNLNGETFSAVQDTFLTDIVSSNSANWNEISAYQANSASYLNESAFGYDANDKISGYNGSAFAGGSDIPTGLYVPLSATVVAIGETSNSARWFSMVQGRQNTAQENSFAQGVTNSASAASLSQGYANTAYEDSFAQGHWNSAVGGSIAQGNSNSARNHSQAFGRGTVVTNTGMAIGNLNKTYTAAFVVGNGTSLSNRSDAFIINHDGSVSAAGKISANGVELGAGTMNESATEAIGYVTATSANIDSTIDNVSSNSGAWGGSALPISAGPGIKFEMVDNTLVASTDETVLYSGYENVGNDGAATYNLTELPTNFNKIKIYWCLRNNTQFDQGNKGVGSVEYDTNLYSADYTYIAGFMEGASNNTAFEIYRYDANISNIRTTSWNQNGRLVRLVDNQVLTNNAMWFHIYKVIGINRISGGN